MLLAKCTAGKWLLALHAMGEISFTVLRERSEARNELSSAARVV